MLNSRKKAQLNLIRKQPAASSSDFSIYNQRLGFGARIPALILPWRRKAKAGFDHASGRIQDLDCSSSNSARRAEDMLAAMAQYAIFLHSTPTLQAITVRDVGHRHHET